MDAQTAVTIPRMTPPEGNPPAADGDLEQQAVEVLTRYGAALRALIADTPGLARRAADLSRTLNVHSKLAWQVHKVAHAQNPLAEAPYLPGPAALDRFLDAARRRGAPLDRISAVRATQEEYERLIKRHARSRGEFDTMLSALAEGGAEKVDLMHRRAAFNAQSHFLGIQAKTHLVCVLYYPSAEADDRCDHAAVRGMIDLRRLRRNATWVLSQMRITDDDAVVRQEVQRESFDPDVEARYGVSILEEFCSRPLPRIERVAGPMGLTNFVVSGDDVGNASVVTCLVGDAFRRACTRYVNAHNRMQICQTLVRTPCEVLVQDVFVHKALGWSRKPRLTVLSDHRGGDPVFFGRDSDRLSVQESVLHLGTGPTVVETPDVPRYQQMVRYTLARLEQNGDDFDVYRCRLEYPVMPSSVAVHFDLPERPR